MSESVYGGESVIGAWYPRNNRTNRNKDVIRNQPITAMPEPESAQNTRVIRLPEEDTTTTDKNTENKTRIIRIPQTEELEQEPETVQKQEKPEKQPTGDIGEIRKQVMDELYQEFYTDIKREVRQELLQEKPEIVREIKDELRERLKADLRNSFTQSEDGGR